MAILLVAPFFGEVLSTATPPLNLLLPWNLALMVGLYGCGALVCREVAYRLRLPFIGLCLLGVAYGVYEEALIDRFWFNKTYWEEVDVGSYSALWHTNVLIATHLTAFHTAVSIGASILVVERLFPAWRDRPWVGRRGQVAAAVSLAVLVPLVCAFLFPWPPLPVYAAAVVLLGAIVATALWTRGRRGRETTWGRSRRRGLGAVAFSCTGAHFLLTYAVPSTGLAPAVGITVALAPIALGVLAVRRLAASGPYGPDGLRVITGILGFFVVLSAVAGLGGRYDLTVAALATWYALRRLRTSTTPPALARG